MVAEAPNGVAVALRVPVEVFRPPLRITPAVLRLQEGPVLGDGNRITRDRERGDTMRNPVGDL
jgi:hypothetical protein